MKFKDYLINMLKGGAIGIAMIIPGVSGGTLAVLLKVYDKIINCLGDLRKDFKNSLIFLSSILLGALIALAAAFAPLKYALDNAPLPTVLLFTGLMIGSCPKLLTDAKKNGFNKLDIISLIVPAAVVIGICFIPGSGAADLSAGMAWYGYILLFLVGIVASCALVVPGISGSMLLMVLGYYDPILDAIKALFSSPLHSILVILCFGVGLVVGFFTIAKLMQYLLKKFPRTTYWSIVSFVLGSIPAILIVFESQYGYAGIDTRSVITGVILLISGAVATFSLTRYAQKRLLK